MAAQSILLGRGIVTLGGLDLGLVSSLVLRHEVRTAAIARLDTLPLGGTAEIAKQTRVFVDFSLHELSDQNRNIIWDISQATAPVELIWQGRNKMRPTCDVDAHVLTVPKFVLLPAAATQLMPGNLDETEIPVTGEALRDLDAPTWYNFTFLPG